MFYARFLTPNRWVARGVGVLLSTVVGICAAAQADVMMVKHAQGQTSIPAKPAKTVVLDVASLDTLHTLGVDVAGLPTTKLPAHMAQYEDKKYLRAGSLFEPDYEALHKAKSDLVIVGGRSATKFKEVARIAPTIDLTVSTDTLVDSVFRNARLLGSIYGKEEVAQQKLAELEASIAQLNDEAASAGTGLVILTSGQRMSAYGPGSRFGVIHDSFGVKPAVTTLKTSNHGQAVSFEFIAKTDPDWLFVIDRDAVVGREGEAAQRLLDNELMHTTKAWKNQRVVYLDALNWYLLGSAGLTSLKANVDQLLRAFNGNSKT